MDALFAYLHVNPVDFFAAFTGGVCAALVSSGTRPNAWNIFVAVVVGTGVGSYGGPVLPPILGYKPSGFASLLIGASGLPIIRGAIYSAKLIKFGPLERKPDLPGGAG